MQTKLARFRGEAVGSREGDIGNSGRLNNDFIEFGIAQENVVMRFAKLSSVDDPMMLWA